MESELPQREQKRLMSEDSQGGEYANDSVALYRDYENKSKCCSMLMRSKTAKLATMLSLILGYFFAELIVGKHIRIYRYSYNGYRENPQNKDKSILGATVFIMLYFVVLANS